MEYKANVKVNLEEIEIIRTLLEVEIKSNKLEIESLNFFEYNKLLNELLGKIQIKEINILEDSLEE